MAPHQLDVELIVVLCTANQCRSPVAAGLLRREAARRGSEVEVESAGLRGGGVAPGDEVLRVANERGLDLHHHRSRQVDWPTLSDADLVVTMTRQQLRAICVEVPSLWPRTFTLRELARRGTAHGPRRADETTAGWLASLHEPRRAAELHDRDLLDDLVDPTGSPPDGFDLMAEDLEVLTSQVATLLWQRDEE